MADLERLEQEFLAATTARHPEVATFLGREEHADRLPDVSPAGWEAKQDFVRLWRERFAAVPTDELSPAERLDVEVFTRSAALWLFCAEELPHWQGNPDPLEELSYLLFTQTLRAAEDPEPRFRALAARLAALPEYLRGFHARIRRGDTLWTEMAHEVAGTFPAFLATIVDRAHGLVPASLERDLREAVHRAQEALEEHVAWLRRLPTAEALWVLDGERFRTLLRLKGIAESPEELEELGLETLARCRAEGARLAAALGPGRSADEVLADLRRDHAQNFAALLEEVRALVAEARQFLAERRLAPVYDWERFVVEPTPSFFRALIPQAAYFPPARFDAVQLGTYVMSPPPAPALLEEYCRASLPLVATHEAYPGHHYHIAGVNRLSRLLREGGILGFPADPVSWYGGDLVEGWAYYAEELMLAQGFHDTPAVRLRFQQKLIRKAARMVVDVRLSTGRLGFQDALEYLRRETDLPAENLLPEVQRYTRTPGYPLGHLLGKLRLEGLRDRVAPDDLYAFHERILRAGVLPVSLLAARWGEGW